MPGPGPDRVVLARALAALPPNHRRVVVLHHLADLSVTEIAQQEDVPEGHGEVLVASGPCRAGGPAGSAE